MPPMEGMSDVMALGEAPAGEAGEVAGFEAFFELERTRLYGALVLLTRDRHEAEELMQDAFLRLLERWDRVSAMEDPAAYLYRSALRWCSWTSSASARRKRRSRSGSRAAPFACSCPGDGRACGRSGPIVDDLNQRLRGVRTRITPPEPAFDRLLDRRDRKRRTSRIASVIAAFVV